MRIKENRDLGLFLLRLGLAFVFIAHGWAKLNGLPGTETFFGSIGIPAPGFMAIFVGAVEFLSGLALLAGAFVPLAGALISIIMIVAIVQVKLARGFIGGYELELTLLLVAISMIFLGPGAWNVKRLVKD